LKFNYIHEAKHIGTFGSVTTVISYEVKTANSDFGDNKTTNNSIV